MDVKEPAKVELSVRRLGVACPHLIYPLIEAGHVLKIEEGFGEVENSGCLGFSDLRRRKIHLEKARGAGAARLPLDDIRFHPFLAEEVADDRRCKIERRPVWLLPHFKGK